MGRRAASEGVLESMTPPMATTKLSIVRRWSTFFMSLLRLRDFAHVRDHETPTNIAGQSRESTNLPSVMQVISWSFRFVFACDMARYMAKRNERAGCSLCWCMELTPLRYFVVISKEGHLTRASVRLGVTQPALSAMLKKLEAHVGTPLLTRTGRGVQLTEAGRVFLSHAESAVRAADQGEAAVRELLGLERGTIRIGGGATAVSYLLPKVVSAMRKEHPGLRFFVREAGSNQVAASVASGALDRGLVTLPITLTDADKLVRVPLMEDEMRLIAPSGDAIGKRASFTWREIAGMPIVGFEAGSAVRDVIDRAARDAGVELDYVMEVRSIEGIMQMVREGIGAGFVSKFALAAESGFGAGIACKEGSLKRQLAIVKRRDPGLSAAAAACERVMLDAAKRLSRR